MTGLLDLLDPDPERRVTMFGVVTGVVTSNADPDKLGRVRVRFPWLPGEPESWWARVAGPAAGKGHGACFIPDPGDEVLVAFEHGDMRFPYVVGSLWSTSRPPLATDGDKDMVIKSPGGHTIVLDDTKGTEQITISDKSGANSIVISSAGGRVTISSASDIAISCPGTLTIDAGAIQIAATADVAVEGGGAVAIKGVTASVEASTSAAVKGTTMSIEGTALVNVKGPQTVERMTSR